MLVVISPAKSMDLESAISTSTFSQPHFLTDAKRLVRGLKKMRPEELSSLMHISSKLGELNHERFANWHAPFNAANARPAIFTFIGDVYLGLKAKELSQADLDYAQQHLRILSGLYGVLKPLDLMQAYRLEMGTRLANGKGTNLYKFWGSKLTRFLNAELAKEDNKVLINLASDEYFSAIAADKLKADIVTPVFKDFSNGQYRFLSFFAKQARGMMASYIIRNRIDRVENLRDFSGGDYRFSEEESAREDSSSRHSKLVFLRKKAP